MPTPMISMYVHSSTSSMTKFAIGGHGGGMDTYPLGWKYVFTAYLSKYGVFKAISSPKMQ